MIPKALIRKDVIEWLEEDIPFWDFTSSEIINEELASAKIIAKQDGMVSGVNVASNVFEQCAVEINECVRDG
ncbi:MAG: hypothetical protein ACXAD7_25160, partial [Candidatus Kariarchaeaceae archaeon]